MTSIEHSSEPRTTRWTQSTVYLDMWVDPDDDPRDSGVATVDERSTLLDYLRRYRLTLEMKCADLDAEELARRSVPPSTMSLLGLVRHMSEVERSWFRRVLAGEDAPPLYYSDADPDGDFDRVEAADSEADLSRWRGEVDACREVARRHGDLDAIAVTKRRGEDVSLRWIYVHMIEEYARHNGHADLLRERIDGTTGE